MQRERQLVAFPTNSSKGSESKVQGSLKEFSLGTWSDLEGRGGSDLSREEKVDGQV